MSIWLIGVGLSAQVVNQLDRWHRLESGTYRPYGASFVQAHLLAYFGVTLTIVGLAVWSITGTGSARRWACVALLGALLQALGLAADIPFHVAGGDSQPAHLLGYVGLAIELTGLARIIGRPHD